MIGPETTGLLQSQGRAIGEAFLESDSTQQPGGFGVRARLEDLLQVSPGGGGLAGFQVVACEKLASLARVGVEPFEGRVEP